MAFRYTLVCDTLGFLSYDVLEEPWSILRAIKDAGYDGADMPGNPALMDGPALRKIVDAVGLDVPELLGAWAFFHGGENRDLAGEDVEARRRGIEYAKKTVDLCAELGAQFFEICAPQPPIPQLPFPKMPLKTMRRNFLDALQEICAHATPLGISILLEPLNAYEAYPGVLTTVFDAMRVCKELEPYEIGIQPDIFHMNAGDPPIPDTIRAAGKYIKHFHVNETNHYRHGDGHADYREIMRALRDIGYDGYLALYMPYTTQAACQLGARGYGTSGDGGGDGAGLRPQLRIYLEGAIRYLKCIESTL